MKQYKTEGAFRSDLCSMLRLQGVSCQPIESGGTADGIPDIYFSSKKYNVRGWIECKRMVIGEDNRITIPYRPGQFPWLSGYVRMGTLCVLAVAMETGIAMFKNEDIKLWYSRAEFFESVLYEPKGIDIAGFLKGD